MPDPTIDRVAPTRLPHGVPVMRHTWRHLLFLHWEVPADELRPLLPPGLELDTFEGKAYVGLVPFTMTGVRPLGTPNIPGFSNFHETNVRTYVHLNGRDPGVWFFSLDAANPVAVVVARASYRLHYHYACMHMDISRDRQRIEYSSERLWPAPTPATCSCRYTRSGQVTRAQVGTLEHFLVERYILYSYARGQLYSGRVYHRAYPLQTAEVESYDETMLAANAIHRPDAPPLVHYANEVRVLVYPLLPVEIN